MQPANNKIMTFQQDSDGPENQLTDRSHSIF